MCDLLFFFSVSILPFRLFRSVLKCSGFIWKCMHYGLYTFLIESLLVVPTNDNSEKCSSCFFNSMACLWSWFTLIVHTIHCLCVVLMLLFSLWVRFFSFALCLSSIELASKDMCFLTSIYVFQHRFKFNNWQYIVRLHCTSLQMTDLAHKIKSQTILNFDYFLQYFFQKIFHQDTFKHI